VLLTANYLKRTSYDVNINVYITSTNAKQFILDLNTNDLVLFGTGNPHARASGGARVWHPHAPLVFWNRRGVLAFLGAHDDFLNNLYL